MKEIFAITSYCNTEEKLTALVRTIKNLEQYEHPVFIHAHYPLPLDIQKMVHSYYYSSDNPILPRYNLFWNYAADYKMEIKSYDLTYTVLKAWRETINLLRDYSRIHMINYDTNITPEIYNMTRNRDRSVFFQNHDTSKLYTLMIYYCLKKKSFEYFSEKLRLENYLEFKTDGPFLPIPEEYLTTIISNDDFYMVPIQDYDPEIMTKYDIATESRFDWNKTLVADDCKIFIGDYGKGSGVLVYDVKKEIKVSVGFFRTPNERSNATAGEMGSVISGTNLYSVEFPMSELDEILIWIDGKKVSEGIFDKLKKLEAKIYKNNL